MDGEGNAAVVAPLAPTTTIMRDAKDTKDVGGGMTKMQTIPIKASKESAGLWRKMKVSAFSVIFAKA